MKRIGGRRGVSAGVRPISSGQILVLILALYAFLFDFATPLTATPIGVVNGKAVRKPSIVAVFVALPVVRTFVYSVADQMVALLAGHLADPVELGCSRRL